MTTPLNTSRTHRQPNAPWSDSERDHAERTVATMILGDLAAPFSRDGTTRAERSRALASRITAYLACVLRPEWQSPPARLLPLRYDDQKLPPERRQEIATQLQSLLGPGLAALDSDDGASGEAVWAAMLTDIVLNEIGQDLLDSPVVYAGDIARAVAHASAYLRATSATWRERGEEALSRASSDILSLIVQEACPYYLLSVQDAGETGVTDLQPH